MERSNPQAFFKLGISMLLLAFSAGASANNSCQATAQSQAKPGLSGLGIGKLCRGAEQSTVPVECYNTVMGPDFARQTGFKWQKGNAVRLCQSAQNTQVRLDCFRAELGKNQPWHQAIKSCKSTGLAAGPQPFVVTAVNTQLAVVDVDKKPVGHPPGSRIHTRNHTQAARITCRGPFKQGKIHNFKHRGEDNWTISLTFKGRMQSGAPGPGECSRSGGFDFFQGLSNGEGILELSTKVPGGASLIKGMIVEQGAVQKVESRLAGNQQLFLQAAVGQRPSHFYVTAQWTSRGGRGMPRIYTVQSINR